MKKISWFLMMLMLAVVPALQSCDDDDDEYYVVRPSTSWDWATVRATGGGGYYLEGDHYGTLEPLRTTIPWYQPVDGQRVVAFFDPLANIEGGMQVVVNGIQEVLTKSVEELTAENEAEYGNDPIVIYQGDMWLGDRYLNLIFEQNVPRFEKHRISLVRNTIQAEAGTGTEGDDAEGEAGESGTETGTDEAASLLDADGYVNLELRYNTYNDRTGQKAWGFVSYNLDEYYPTDEAELAAMKGFKVKINSQTNGDVTVVLDFDHPVGVPEKAQEVHSISSFVD